MELNNKGFFFTVDALIAVFIIFLVMIIYSPSETYIRTGSDLPSDVLKSFSTLRVYETNNSYLQGLVASGQIARLNNTLLEQIGEFYVINKTLARELTSALLGDLRVNENFGIWFGNDLIYSSNRTAYPNATDIDVERQTISGLENNGSVRGFSARAFLSSDKVTDYYYFGGYVGDGNISILVNCNGTLNSADMELAINKSFQVYINDNFAGSYSASPSTTQPTNYSLNISKFSSGQNIVELRGNNLFVAGGFLKVRYIGGVSFTQNETTYRFPGIKGLINVYDGFYVSGNLNSMEIFIHVNSSSSPFFLTLGNVTILNKTTVGEERINLTNANISALMSYGPLVNKNVPLRIGLENVTLIGTTTLLDVFSVSDLSTSMECSCSNSHYSTKSQCISHGGTWTCPIEDAKNATNLLIDLILNFSGNKVGLSGYEYYAKKLDFYQLSNNSVSLKNVVNNNWDANGHTCICCGILKAINCFDEKVFSNNFNGQTAGNNPFGWTIDESGGPIDITSNALEGDRAVLLRKSQSGQSSVWHRFAPQEDPLILEFLINHSAGTNGTAVIKLRGDITSSGAIPIYGDYITLKLYNNSIKNGNTFVTNYSRGEKYKIKVEIVPGASTYKLYVNDSLINGTLPVTTTRSNVAAIMFTTESASPINYTFDDIKVNLTQKLCDNVSMVNRTRSMIVLTDGDANIDCGFAPLSDGSYGAGNDAIKSACMAYNNYSITVYAVGLGSSANTSVLQPMVDESCGNGDYYGNINASDLAEIYRQIATSLVLKYQEQTFQVQGNLSSRLYEDSYIKYVHSSGDAPPYGTVGYVEKQFSNSTGGSFLLSSDSQIINARIASYSGSKWTDKVFLNNQIVYNLSQFGKDYLKLGDPYNIVLPNGLIAFGKNNVSLTTGISPTNTSAGSQYDKIIYEFLKEASTYSDIKKLAEGCNWTVGFEDGTSLSNLPIPSDYVGSDLCVYNSSTQTYDSNDALQTAVFQLFQQLDLDLNGKVDMTLNIGDIHVGFDEVTGVPFTVDTEVQVRRWLP
jgi:hypothetical protein